MTKMPPPLAPNSHPTYRSLLGKENWNRLHAAIRRRFSEDYYAKPVIYTGKMHEIYLSKAGKVLAQLCRLIGTPLALYSGKNVPTNVHVYKNEELNGVTWDRHYFYPNKPTNRVKSTKCLTPHAGLIEVVGCGFGMQLKLYEKDQGLYFESTQFFGTLGNYRIKIPHWLSPGKTIVCQIAIDDAIFQFTFEVTHPLFGKLFYQSGEFQER